MVLKIITVGDSGVGKTSLLLALLKHVSPNHPALASHAQQEPGYETVPTIGVDQFDLVLGNGVPVELWDTAGQERFMSLTANYFRDADIVVVVCAAPDGDSVKSLRNRWIKTMAENTIGRSTSILVVCNKTDHPTCDPGVTRDAEALAMQHGAAFVTASAKSGDVVELGKELAKLVVEKHKPATGAAVGPGGLRQRNQTTTTMRGNRPRQAAVSQDGCCA